MPHMDEHRAPRPNRETFPAPQCHRETHARGALALAALFEGIPLGDPSPLARSRAPKVRA